MAIMINNNENVIEDINRKNELFIRELMNKDSFMLDWYSGAVLPKHHPRYYDGRIEVNIRKSFNSSYGSINFGKDEYEVTDEVVNNLYNYIETNIDKLIKLSLNQSTEMYEGVSDSLRIKFKSVYVSISGINASTEEEKNEINKIKDDIKNIIIVNKKEVNEMDNNVMKIVKEICENYGMSVDTFDITNLEGTTASIMTPKESQRGIGGFIIAGDGSYLTCGSMYPLTYYIDKFKEGERDSIFKNKDIVNDIINKIKEAPMDTELTIAKLINYNPEVNMVEPLTQGEVFTAVEYNCKKNGIAIERIESGFGGLAYNYPFKKIDLKLSNGKYAEDQETKEAFEGYMSKVEKYNEQVANGEKPDVKMGDLLNEYTDTFYDEALEEKMKKTEEDFNNREKDTKINDLINQIDNKLESINKEDKIKAAANEIVAKIAELPIGSEFVIGEYFTDYKFEMKENFKLMEEVISLCKSNNIQIENTQDGMILGMPWVYKYKKNN